MMYLQVFLLVEQNYKVFIGPQLICSLFFHWIVLENVKKNSMKGKRMLTTGAKQREE